MKSNGTRYCQQSGAKFIGIPSIFLHHYKETLARWMDQYQKYGRKFTVWINKDLLGAAVIGDGSSPSMVPAQTQVTLTGDIVRADGALILVVRPETQRDAKIIEKHCEDLEDLYDKDKDNLGGIGRGLRGI